jgi:hypothetical protein
MIDRLYCLAYISQFREQSAPIEHGNEAVRINVLQHIQRLQQLQQLLMSNLPLSADIV